MAAAKGVSLFKQACHEIPDIVGGTALALASLVGIFFVYQHKKSTGELDIKRYRFKYTVVRPGDPMCRHAPPETKKLFNLE